MSILLAGAALFLLLNLLIGVLRIYQGPTAADRMLAVLLFGSTSVAIMLLLAYAIGDPTLVIVALVFIALAVLVSIAFVALPRAPAEPRDS